MYANALQLPCRQALPAQASEAPHSRRTSIVICFDGLPLAELPGELSAYKGQRRVLAFLLVMAAVSLASEVGGCLVGAALRAWFGLTIEPWLLSLVLQLTVTLVGTRVASLYTGAAHHSAARWQILLALLAATGISLILAWLSRLVGQATTLDWPLALVYLLWASASSVATG